MRQLKNQSESQSILTLLWFLVFYRHLWGHQNIELEEMCPCIFFTREYFLKIFSQHQKIFLTKISDDDFSPKSNLISSGRLICFFKKSCYCIWLHRLPNKFANICFFCQMANLQIFVKWQIYNHLLLFCLVKWEMLQRVFVIQASSHSQFRTICNKPAENLLFIYLFTIVRVRACEINVLKE